MLIKINGKEQDYEIGFYSYAFNDAIDPTGLGSIGIYTEYNSTKLFIGIKNDVIDVITNKNCSIFLNLENDILAKSESLTDKSKFGDGVLKKLYINEIELQIDLALFRYFVYHKNIENYAKMFSKWVAKDDVNLPGALLKIETPFELGTDGLFIGYICIKNQEMLVLDKTIVEEDVLVDEVRYNIWKIKQNIAPFTLKRGTCSSVFENVKTYQDNGYADYFNGTYDSIGEASKSGVSFEKGGTLDKKHFSGPAHITPPSTSNEDFDVFQAGNTKIAPGFINNKNMTNFGLKETRKGYFQLKKGETWLNVGYKYKDFLFADNFYTTSKPDAIVEPLSHFSLPLKTTIHVFPEILNHALEAKKLMAFLYQELYIKLPKTKEEAENILTDFLIENILYKGLYAGPLEAISVNVALSVSYLDYVDKQPIKPGTTMIVTHPFYDKAFVVDVTMKNIKYFNNKIYTSPITQHKFGLDKGTFYFKNMEKEYRKTNSLTLPDFNRKIYLDLSWEHAHLSLPVFDIKDYIENKEAPVKFLESNINNFAHTYFVSTEELIKSVGEDNVSIGEHPMGAENTYIKINNKGQL